jgi:biotin carboxylase
MGRHVVVVDPYSSGARFAEAFTKRGLIPVGVTSFPSPPPIYTSAFRPTDFGVLLSADVGTAALIEALRPFDPVAVVPGAESGVLLADMLAAALTPALANEPSLSAARRHKGAMVESITAAGLRSIRTARVDSVAGAEAAVAAASLTGVDLVVKPVLSGGSEDVTMLPGGTGLAELLARLLGKVNVLNIRNDEILIQERLHGIEYVVDTLSWNGRHTVTDICRYEKGTDGGGFAVYQGIEFLPYDAPGHAELVDYVGRALDALGVRFGLAHNEVMVTADGPVLIESGVRVAGGSLPALTELAVGESGIDLLAQSLTDGRPPPRQDYTLRWPVSVVYLTMRKAGTVSNTAAYEKIRALRSCRFLKIGVKDGDLVSPTTDLLSTLGLGWAVLAHHDLERIARDRAAIREIEAEVVIHESAA